LLSFVGDLIDKIPPGMFRIILAIVGAFLLMLAWQGNGRQAKNIGARVLK
jgi:hypothetical protein